MMILHGVLHDGQTKAGAAGLFGMTLIHTIEAFKHFVLMFGRNTDTGILHAQQHFTGLLSHIHFHAAAGVVVLNGIVAKVVNDLIRLISMLPIGIEVVFRRVTPSKEPLAI